MTWQISVSAAFDPASAKQFTIDEIPADSRGLKMSILLDSSWLGLIGLLFELLLEVSFDGKEFVHFRTVNIGAGPVLRKDGSLKLTWDLMTTWSSGPDGQGGRLMHRPVVLRATLTARQRFSTKRFEMQVF